MTLQQSIMLALQASIVLTVFGFGLRATVADILYVVVRRPGLLARSLAAMFVIMPIVAIAIANTFDLRLSVEIMLVSLAISPLPPLLPGKERKQGGDAAYGLGLLVVVSLLSIAIVPVAVELLGRFFGKPFLMSPIVVAKAVMIAAILPLAAGLLVRAMWPALADRFARPVALVATLMLAISALPVLIGMFPTVLALIGGGTLLAMIAFVVVGLTVGHILGAPAVEDRLVLALSTTSRHPAIALSIAKANFPDEPYLGATILLYLAVNILVGIPYLAWQRKRRERASTEGHATRRTPAQL